MVSTTCGRGWVYTPDYTRFPPLTHPLPQVVLTICSTLRTTRSALLHSALSHSALSLLRTPHFFRTVLHSCVHR